MKHPVTINFTGVPGCGKSYAMQFLEQCIKDQPLAKPHFEILQINDELHQMVINIVDGKLPVKPKQ